MENIYGRIAWVTHFFNDEFPKEHRTLRYIQKVKQPFPLEDPLELKSRFPYPPGSTVHVAIQLHSVYVAIYHLDIYIIYNYEFENLLKNFTLISFVFIFTCSRDFLICI